MKKIIFIILTCFTLSCNTKSDKELEEVNLYSQRHYSVDEKQYENFEKKNWNKSKCSKS